MQNIFKAFFNTRKEKNILYSSFKIFGHLFFIVFPNCQDNIKKKKEKCTSEPFLRNIKDICDSFGPDLAASI